jgi:hypothetical protein
MVAFEWDKEILHCRSNRMKPNARRFDMSDERCTPAPDTGMLFYQTEDGQSRIQVRLHDETVWLSQRLLAELYQVAVPTINLHISTICSDHELTPEATIRKFRIVQTEGSRQVERLVDFYNLDNDSGHRLPGARPPGPAVSPLGYEAPERVYRQRLRVGR